MLVSIMIPYIRPQKVQRCISAAIENAGINPGDIEIVAEEDTERIGAPKMVKRLTEKSSGNLVCFLGDDCIPQKDWLKWALMAMETLPDGWGLVGLDDNIRLKGQIKAAAHWLADKRLLPLLGGEFFHTGYWHCWCDNELTIRCAELGRYVQCQRSFVYHEHPIVDERHNDQDYQRVYSDEWYSHDLILFRKRRANKWKTS